VFALMGLRQLYFLLGGLLDRLVYLSVGLAVVLGFIGAKLILEALHENNLPFVNDGRPVDWAPDISITVSLAFILGTLALTTVASLAKSTWDARRVLLASGAPAAAEIAAGVGGEFGGEFGGEPAAGTDDQPPAR
jgi:tellurite resistance protein TerC